MALNHGDQVGLLTFSDEIHGYVPPGGGSGHMNRLLHESVQSLSAARREPLRPAFWYCGPSAASGRWWC